MSVITIRRASIEEIPAIQTLNHELFKSDNIFYGDLNINWPYEEEGEAYFRRCVSETERFVSFVAIREDEIIGYMNGHIRKDNPAMRDIRAEISNMYVSKKHRSAGAGSLLIDEFKRWARQKNAKYLLVGAFAANERAINFYQKNIE